MVLIEISYQINDTKFDYFKSISNEGHITGKFKRTIIDSWYDDGIKKLECGYYYSSIKAKFWQKRKIRVFYL